MKDPDLKATARPYPGALFVDGTLEQGEDANPTAALGRAYRRLLGEAGFVDIDVETTRVYEFKDAGIEDVLWREVNGRIMGAFIRARKP